MAPFYHSHFADPTKTAAFFFTCLGTFIAGTVVYLAVYQLTGGNQTFRDDQVLELGSCHHEGSRPPRRNNSFCPSATEDGVLSEREELEQKNQRDLLGAENISVREMFGWVKFHLYLWSGAIILAANPLALTNSCLLLQSLGLRQYQDSLIVTMMLTMAMSNLTAGVLYDCLKTVSREVYLIIAGAECNITSVTVILMTVDSLALVFIWGVLTSLTTGGGLSNLSELQREYFRFEAHRHGAGHTGDLF